VDTVADVRDEGERLYWFETAPGDRDHMESYCFRHGVVRAGPEDIAALTAAVRAEHPWQLTVLPVENGALDLTALRVLTGSALDTSHNVSESDLCEDDEPLILIAASDVVAPERVAKRACVERARVAAQVATAERAAARQVREAAWAALEAEDAKLAAVAWTELKPAPTAAAADEERARSAAPNLRVYLRRLIWDLRRLADADYAHGLIVREEQEAISAAADTALDALVEPGEVTFRPRPLLAFVHQVRAITEMRTADPASGDSLLVKQAQKVHGLLDVIERRARGAAPRVA
jgi:hypothetical protein